MNQRHDIHFRFYAQASESPANFFGVSAHCSEILEICAEILELVA
jgi:hypothetical protein